jgi:hypothetical protein
VFFSLLYRSDTSLKYAEIFIPNKLSYSFLVSFNIWQIFNYWRLSQKCIFTVSVIKSGSNYVQYIVFDCGALMLIIRAVFYLFFPHAIDSSNKLGYCVQCPKLWISPFISLWCQLTFYSVSLSYKCKLSFIKVRLSFSLAKIIWGFLYLRCTMFWNNVWLR